MKVSLNGINEFVDLKGIDIKEIVSRFSLATAEIEGYEKKGTDIKNVVVAEIKSCERVPESNKLWKLMVDCGDNVVQVMCGAPNCRVGLKTAFAKVGAVIGDIKIGKAKLAGYESNGMCLGGDELGINNDHSGIIELNAEFKNGADIKTVLPIEDIIIEIDNKSLTNRPDLWGHYGIARELAVIFNKPLKRLVDLGILDKYKNLPSIPVAIENKKDCLSYGAIRVDNITRTVSPIFMQIRLFYCGINAHGFLVDLTNYIMLETSQPNHAFDARHIGKISVGNEKSGVFVTLKDQEVKIMPEMLFIKSDGKPVALAGVIGGKNSEIESNTTDCVFEFATFDATCVRKTATAIGTRTDASNRYEKSLDVNLNAVACARTLEFVEKYDLGAKVVSSFNHVVSQVAKPINVSVKKDYLERFCGMPINYNLVEHNLVGLGFAPIVTGDEIKVTVPSWRATKDISCTADLIEEIVRTFGYDNILPVAPKVAIKPVEKLSHALLSSRIKDLLCDKYAFDEVHTYIWKDTKLERQLGIQTPSYLRVVNSCIKDDDALRSHIVPSLLCATFKNRNLDDIRIFEIGRVCKGKDKNGNAIENTSLGLCVASKKIGAEDLYKKLSETVRDILRLVGYKVSYRLSVLDVNDANYWHPKNNAEIIVGGAVVGSIGVIHPSVSSVIGAKMGVACAGINLSILNQIATLDTEKVRISKYQKSVLDFTFVTDKIYSAVETIFDKFSHALFMGYQLKDVYSDEGEGSNKGHGKISYTLAFTIGSYDKTLTSEDIEEVHKAIIAHGKKGGLVLKDGTVF